MKTDIVFAAAGGTNLTLDVFVPQGEGPFPTCILVHGGAAQLSEALEEAVTGHQIAKGRRQIGQIAALGQQRLAGGTQLDRHDLTGQIFAMFVLTVAAGEAAIGLAILVIYFRGRGTIAVDDVNRMKG